MLKNIFAFTLTTLVLTSCAYFDNANTPDPFTGGVNTASSNLLEVPLPAGLQTYPSHGFITTSAQGVKQGLETLRGYVNMRDTAMALFNTLKTGGWQLKTYSRKGERAFYLYQKNDEYAGLVFRPQGALVILEIWRGQELPTGAEPSFSPIPETSEDGLSSIAPEEYGALESNESDNSVEERWGNKPSLEEKPL